MDSRKQLGFTLYELLIPIVIVEIILGFGVPNLVQFSNNNRLTTAANDLHAAFQLARTEAARARTNITICASSAPMDAASDCDGTWDQGFIVFVDTNGDIARSGATETVLRAHPPTDPTVNLRVADDARFFSYASTGLGRGDVGGNAAISQVVMCDKRGTAMADSQSSAARLFVATPLGRATILRNKDMIDTALSDMSETCP